MDGARDSGINANHVSLSGGEREKGRAGGRLISARITIYSYWTNYIGNLKLAEISKNDLLTADSGTDILRGDLNSEH